MGATLWYMVLVLVSVMYSVCQGQTTDSTPSYNISKGCRLLPTDPYLTSRVRELAVEETKLLQYELVIVGYTQNPLVANMTQHFKADHWHRVFHHHGHVLLSLTFNYDMLSLSLLQIGVENMKVELRDEPQGCLSNMDEESKIELVQDLLLRDFSTDTTEVPVLDKHNYVCHQILHIRDNDKHGQFVDKCCTITPNTHKLSCHSEETNTILTILYSLLLAVKIGFLLFGPLVLQKWIYTDSVKWKSYTVHLTSPVQEHVTPKQAKRYGSAPTDPIMQSQGKSKEYAFQSLHILVDHKRLMTERSVPVGFFHFFIKKFLNCEITYSEPFDSCCSQSIFGSWTRWFLCMSLCEAEPVCSRKTKVCCSWRHVFKVIGGILVFGLISLPYILRILVFFWFEDPEIQQRKQSLERMKVNVKIDHNIFHHLTPTHSFLIAGYILYIISFFLIAGMRRMFKIEFDSLVRPAVDDLRHVSYTEAVRMVVAHLLLPFEKFGVFGLLVSVLYLPVMLCLCLIALACYCIPTLYMIGRLLVHHRPACFKKHIKTSSSNLSEVHQQQQHSLSKGADTVDSALLLENISHDAADDAKHMTATDYSDQERLTRKQKVRSRLPCFLEFIIGISCIINMCALLGMYAEVFGFLAEVLFLTLMGVIVNASTAHKYIMLAFWITMYTTTCFNKVYEAYFSVNTKIFSFLKDKLKSSVMQYTILPEEFQKCIAFKYFTADELENLKGLWRTQAPVCPSISSISGSEPDLSHQGCDIPHEHLWSDKHGRLFWKCCSLVLFVDQYDVPRIPKDLFYLISEQELIGCPGPVYKSMGKAFKYLLYLVIFLLFVFLIILLFGSFYDLSSTNQLLLTAVGGFIPTMIIRILLPKVNHDVDLNTYTFHGRIQQLLYNYAQSWPVAKLEGLPVTHSQPNDGPDADNLHSRTVAQS